MTAESRVLVNTGNGKGKTTAALGTVMRSVARDWKVCVIQFLKSGKWKVGEEKVARELGVDWWSIGEGFTWDSTDMDATEALGRAAPPELIEVADTVTEMVPVRHAFDQGIPGRKGIEF